MRPDDRTWIRHLREAATKAVGYGAGKQRSDLDDDELLRLALTKLIEIVGEAAKSVTLDGRAALPQVPWRAAARMRDRSCPTTSTSTSTFSGRRSLKIYRS